MILAARPSGVTVWTPNRPPALLSETVWRSADGRAACFRRNSLCLAAGRVAVLPNGRDRLDRVDRHPFRVTSRRGLAGGQRVKSQCGSRFWVGGTMNQNAASQQNAPLLNYAAKSRLIGS